jgi:hypothetical protein|tara:strand:- start:89 stop:301 length:213 start_codon:yes stop_codon:yes gene_type:complete
MTARDIEIGDLVNPGFYGSCFGVVSEIYIPNRRNIHDGFKTRAKIFMSDNLKTYNVAITDLVLVSKGRKK